MSKDMQSEYEKWHAQQQLEQMVLAKERKSSFEKFTLKSTNKDKQIPTKSTSDTTEDDIQKENDTIVQEMTYTSEASTDQKQTNKQELTDQEKWHIEQQKAQMELANKRRASFNKFQMLSNNN